MIRCTAHLRSSRSECPGKGQVLGDTSTCIYAYIHASEVAYATGDAKTTRSNPFPDKALAVDLDQASTQGGKEKRRETMLAWMLDPTKGKVPM